MKNILFIIGSLRKESFNKKLAEEVEQMLAGRATVEYLDYSDVPLMNQDIFSPPFLLSPCNIYSIYRRKFTKVIEPFTFQ